MTGYYMWNNGLDWGTSPVYTDIATTNAWSSYAQGGEVHPQTGAPKFKAGDLVRLMRDSLNMKADGTTLAVQKYVSLSGAPRVFVKTLATSYRVPMVGGGALNLFAVREEDLEYV